MKEIFDRVAATYDRAAFPFFAPFGEALVEFAAVGPEDRVLDVGCGAGAVLAPAARRAAGATGIELSPLMAERARAAAPGAEVVVGDAAELPFGDASFDVVLASFVVFFMADPTAALREWARVLAPGGRLVISTWGDPDPRWSFERDLRRGFAAQIDPAVLQEIGRGLALLERFATPENVLAELAAAGFGTADVTEHAIEFVFRDEQDWWDWNWSHGSRVFLEAIPDAAHEELRRQVGEAMKKLRDERGFPRIYTALFARATLAESHPSL